VEARNLRQRITADEITTINGHIFDIGFKFPDLWDPSFLNSLALDDVAHAQKIVADVRRDDEVRTSASQDRLKTLASLKTELEGLFFQEDRQAAGLALEKLLNQLFRLFDLAPRAPFKLVGEQIDGSFELDNAIYLLEAKWEKAPSQEKDLLVFRGKIEGKASFTRGMFIAMNGVTRDAATAILVGKQPTFFVATGHDLMMILQGALALDEFLRRRVRLLAEEAAVTATFDRITTPR
jgi:hypothetical protein